MKKTKIQIANPNELSVSVNPGCFNLAENGERKSTFDISNNNGFPLYFKLMASNSHAMKFQPECGKLGPYGSVTVTGYHVQSARPIGLQQKVAIMTSKLPLEEWPDQEHYKLDTFSSPSKKRRSPSKSFVPTSPSPHFDRYEHEILKVSRRHGDHAVTTNEKLTDSSPERRLITTLERPMDPSPERRTASERRTVTTTERRHMVSSPDRRTTTTTERQQHMVSTPERKANSANERRQIISTPDRRTTTTTERRQMLSTPEKRPNTANERRQMISSPDRPTNNTTERRQIIYTPDRQTTTTNERRQIVYTPDRRTTTANERRKVVYTPDRHTTTNERRQIVYTPDRRTTTTNERRQMVSSPDRRMPTATERLQIVSSPERRTSNDAERQQTTTERRLPITERWSSVASKERRTVPVAETHAVLSDEGLYEEPGRLVKNKGGFKDKADIRSKRIDILCHCRNCKGSSVMKGGKRVENRMKCEVVKKSCQGVSSDDGDSIYQNTVTLELEQLPTSSSESYGSCLSSENSCLIEKFNMMLQECNKILTITQYNFILILLLLLVIIISSRHVVLSYLWPQPFCHKYPWFNHYFGAK